MSVWYGNYRQTSPCMKRGAFTSGYHSPSGRTLWARHRTPGVPLSFRDMKQQEDRRNRSRRQKRAREFLQDAALEYERACLQRAFAGFYAAGMTADTLLNRTDGEADGEAMPCCS